MRELAEEIWLLKFDKGRKEFHQALQGPEAIRQELEASGKSWRLPSGAYILVYAHQYQHAMASLNGRALYPSNVVVSATWLPLLEEIVRSRISRSRSRARSRISHREILAAPDAANAAKPLEPGLDFGAIRTGRKHAWQWLRRPLGQYRHEEEDGSSEGGGGETMGGR